MNAATASTQGSRAPWPLVAIVAASATLAVAGAWNVVGALRGEAAHQAAAPAAPAKGFALGQDVPSSFGVVAIEHVEKLAGLTAKSLAGVTHGVNGLVRAGRSRVQIYATLTNLTDRPLRYDPAQFALSESRSGARPVRPVSASVRPGLLQPDASIDLQVAFVMAQRRQRLWAQFADPGASQPIAIDLGRVARQRAPAPAVAVGQGDGAGHGHGR